MLIPVSADFVGIPELELTFGPAVMEHNISIPIVDNSALEDEEVFFVQLSVPHDEKGVKFLVDRANVSILDDDSKLLFSTLNYHNYFVKFSLLKYFWQLCMN